MASPRERKTAEGINGGLTVRAAMEAAGYQQSYAVKQQAYLRRKLEAEGLITTDEDVRAVKDRVLAILRENAEAVATALVVAAKTGDVVAQKAVLDRAAGPVPKRHEISTDDVDTVVREMLAAAARELDADTLDRLAEAWRRVLEERKRP